MAEIKPAALELGTERIRKLLVQYAVPAIIAMTASSLYNMVDSIFIGQGVGPLAISGLALTFPLMNLSAAFGAMVGVGAATQISMRLGQRDYATAQQVLGNVLTLNTIIGILFAVIMLLFLYDLPSGLTLYWTISNLFSIIQLWLQKRRGQTLQNAAPQGK